MRKSYWIRKIVIVIIVSNTTYVVCVNFIHKWRNLQFKVDSERQSFLRNFSWQFSIYFKSFFPKSVERKSSNTFRETRILAFRLISQDTTYQTTATSIIEPYLTINLEGYLYNRGTFFLPKIEYYNLYGMYCNKSTDFALLHEKLSEGLILEFALLGFILWDHVENFVWFPNIFSFDFVRMSIFFFNIAHHHSIVLQNRGKIVSIFEFPK